MNDIELSTIINRQDKLFFSQIDNEIVMLSIENGEYYGFGTTGSAIWEAIEKPISLSEIVNILMVSFDVEYNKCLAETISFIKTLENKGLITLSNK